MAFARMIALILIAVAAYLLTDALVFRGAEPVSPEEVERALMTTPAARAVTVLRERAPEDHARVLAAFSNTLSGRGDPDEAAVALQEAVAHLVRQRAPDLRRAPQRSVVRVIESQLAILEALREDPATCGRVALHGTRTLDREQRAELSPLAAEAAADVLVALYEGRDSTAPEIAGPSDIDYTEVIKGWQRRGATPDQINQILTPSAASPEFCTAAIDFLTYLSRTEGVSAKRVRTDLLVSMLEG